MDISKIENLVTHVQLHLDDEAAQITTLLENPQDIENASEEDKLHAIQLILQYRLSAEEALSLLLKMDQNLLAVLGIQPNNSAKQNIERLGYSLGNEDLKQILNVLAILTGYLFNILNRYQSKEAKFKIKQQRTLTKTSRFIQNLSKISTKQAQCLESLKKLHLDLERLVKYEPEGPVFDHIAALRGPINQFHQAVLHGLAQTETLYPLIKQKVSLDATLHTVLRNAEAAFHMVAEHHRPDPSLHLKQDDHSITEQLEQRASAKRLRPFFA